MDAHVHVRDAAGLADAAAAGILALRDAGAPSCSGLMQLKQTAREQGIVFRSSCAALYRSGGYGSRIGVPLASSTARGEQILLLRRGGADIIKAVASGMVSLKMPGTVTAGGLEANELREVVHEARKAGLDVMAHANGETAIRNSIEAGVVSIEHGFFMTEELLVLMQERGIFWVPTAAALKHAAGAAGTLPEAKAFAARTVQEHRRMIGQAFSMGVRLAIGTDCVLPDPAYPQRYQDELALFRQAGIPADEVERIATAGGRALLGIEE